MLCVSLSLSVRHLTLVINVTWHAHAVRTMQLTWLLVPSLSLSFYQSEHMTLSILAAKQKGPCVCSPFFFFNTLNLHASQFIATFSLECSDRVAILSHEQP